MVPQLRQHVDPHIPQEQFGFIRGSSALDAGVCLALTIATTINQRAEVQLMALDIKEPFDSIWWKNLLAQL